MISSLTVPTRVAVTVTAICLMASLGFSSQKRGAPVSRPFKVNTNSYSSEPGLAGQSLRLVQAAVAAWNMHRPSKFDFWYNGTSTLSGCGDPGATVVFGDPRTNAPGMECGSGLIAGTSDCGNGHFTIAHMVSCYNFTTGFETLSPPAMDFQAVTTHEFGHALRMTHTTVPGCSMSGRIRNPCNEDLDHASYMYQSPYTWEGDPSFENLAVGVCPAGLSPAMGIGGDWTCSGDAEVASIGDGQGCAVPAGIEGSKYVKAGCDSTTGSMRSPNFTLPSNIAEIRLLRAGGADSPSSGFKVKRASDNAVLCQDWSGGADTDTFFETTCPALAAFAGTSVYFEIVDTQTSGWGKVYVDRIRLINQSGQEIQVGGHRDNGLVFKQDNDGAPPASTDWSGATYFGPVTDGPGGVDAVAAWNGATYTLIARTDWTTSPHTIKVCRANSSDTCVADVTIPPPPTSRSVLRRPTLVYDRWRGRTWLFAAAGPRDVKAAFSADAWIYVWTSDDAGLNWTFRDYVSYPGVGGPAQSRLPIGATYDEVSDSIVLVFVAHVQTGTGAFPPGMTEEIQLATHPAATVSSSEWNVQRFGATANLFGYTAPAVYCYYEGVVGPGIFNCEAFVSGLDDARSIWKFRFWINYNSNRSLGAVTAGEFVGGATDDTIDVAGNDTTGYVVAVRGTDNVLYVQTKTHHSSSWSGWSGVWNGFSFDQTSLPPSVFVRTAVAGENRLRILR